MQRMKAGDGCCAELPSSLGCLVYDLPPLVLVYNGFASFTLTLEPASINVLKAFSSVAHSQSKRFTIGKQNH